MDSRSLPESNRADLSIGSTDSRDAMFVESFQEEFARAIFDPDHPVPASLVDPDGERSEKRFAVYRNNIVLGLCDCLRDAYPVVSRIVGDTFFQAMARIYVAQQPPNSPVMLEYGDSFAAFLAAFAPVTSLPYLSDVARIERALVEAYHAAECRHAEIKDISEIGTYDLSGISFEFHPSSRVVASRFPAFTIWRTNKGDTEPHFVDLGAGGEEMLIGRPDDEAEIRLLPRGGSVFVKALMSGAPILLAAEAAFEMASDFDLSGAITCLLSARVITAISSPTPEEPT